MTVGQSSIASFIRDALCVLDVCNRHSSDIRKMKFGFPLRVALPI